MGVLKNLTDEYFEKTARTEDIRFNEDELIPVDMGCSVLWADRDLTKNYGDDFLYKYLQFKEIEDVKFRHGWRLPLLEDYFELLKNEHIERKTSTVKTIFRNNETGESMDFLHIGCYRNGMWDESNYRLTGEIYSSFGATSSYKAFKMIYIFDVAWTFKKLQKDIFTRKDLTSVLDTLNVPVRLIKDK